MDKDKIATPINSCSLVMSGRWCSVAKQYFRTLSNNSDFRIKLFSVRLYLLFFLEGFVSYLCYLWLFAYSGVKHILCCAFVLFVFVLCAPGFNFALPLRYSLPFIYFQLSKHPYIYLLLLAIFATDMTQILPT